MAQMVADVLVGVLEQIGVGKSSARGDSLNALGDAVRRSKIEWIGVRHEEGAALALRSKPNSLVASEYARARTRQERTS